MTETSNDAARARPIGSSSSGLFGVSVQQGALPPALRLLRPHQWVKNAFVAAPLFFTPDALSLDSVVRILVGIMAFCAVASAVYVLNDYADRESDRRHPVKQTRPLASGEVSGPFALGLLGALLAGGMIVGFALSPMFGALIASYFAINVAYSFGLKNVSIVDVLVIASGFVLRVFAGAVLLSVVPSVWIIICTGLIALFLALAKRRDDLVRSLGNDHRRSLKGYTKQYLDTSVTIVLAALLISYMLYTTDADVLARLGTEQLYLTIPFVVAGVLRYLQIMMVEEKSGAPTVIILTDRFLIASMFLWALSIVLLIHL